MSEKFTLDIGQRVLASSGESYTNIQILGSGGNAITFCVLCTSGPNHGALFALKVFRRISDADRRAKFHEEIAFLKACNLRLDVLPARSL